ncbi:glycosyltransferase family 4 protein [Nocardioides carbamazepini]|uniref:glycosyltransferase family 4 protein n=1 Tax=Nocardioides carbamazepini TaxID=2854259 RepID=UPI00214A4571|nr:glycosyltransferase family 4 protein [Nocardioides carbamazepini]MCR1786602.1 glycosyltransferase family 4 protein [Nocardioides carbamazepini]
MTVHFLVPDGIDDPRHPSGGNVYDRRLGAALADLGVPVHEHRVGAAGPGPLLARLPEGAVVLVDGLIASTTDVLVAESCRLRVAVLLHMPGSGPAEPVVLRAVHAVVTTSAWARRWVLERQVPADRVQVAVPGADRGPVVTGSADGTRLLCVGPVTPAKGYDDLLTALAEVRDLAWRCRCVGALDLTPSYVGRLRERARGLDLADRVELVGPLPPARLDAVRAVTDLVVAPSRRESYGMALAEGLARGLPAIATDVGGHPEALGPAAGGSLPGTLVPVGDPTAFARALREWLGDAVLRDRWRRAAATRRQGLGGWGRTATEVAHVLNRIAPGPVVPVVGRR